MGTNFIYDGDDIPIAKNVFLMVDLNGYWRLPVGYLFIDGLSSVERSNLFSKTIELISDAPAHLN